MGAGTRCFTYSGDACHSAKVMLDLAGVIWTFNMNTCGTWSTPSWPCVLLLCRVVRCPNSANIKPLKLNVVSWSTKSITRLITRYRYLYDVLGTVSILGLLAIEIWAFEIRPGKEIWADIWADIPDILGLSGKKGKNRKFINTVKI